MSPDRLRLGAVLPDYGKNGNSHMKIYLDNGKRTYDLDLFRSSFGNLMRSDDLYLGYYLHLVQDILFRHFVYDKYHWDPLVPGNIERLHKDYSAANSYIISEYGLMNDIVIPEGFENEDICHICSFDTERLVKSMKSYFLPVEYKDIFFFTKEMSDEFIHLAVGYCIEETERLKNNNGMDMYDYAWSHNNSGSISEK